MSTTSAKQAERERRSQGGPAADRAGRRLELRVLGPLEAMADGAPLALGGPKQRTTLALLVADAGKVVSTDALIDGIWGEDPTPAARSTLHTYISNLRQELGDAIVREGGGYRLDVDPRNVDVALFEDAVARAATLAEPDPAAAAQTLRSALALWRGHAYADVLQSFRLGLEARRLDELRLAAVEARVEADLALGRHAELVPELEVLCGEFPYREAFRRQHMLALYRSGRQTEALRAYRRTRSLLADELGLEPSPQLQELERRILNQDDSLLLDTEPQVQVVAFLLTDIEDSTILWELHTKAMRAAVAEHDRIVGDSAERAGGRIVKRVGDGVDLAFPDVARAVEAAGEIQRRLGEVAWGETGELLVRMAIDVGEVEARGGDYFGPVLNRAGRLLAAAHGGQVLLSGDAHAALSATSSGWQAKALGEFRLKGIGAPVTVFQLLVEGRPADFPALRLGQLPTSARRGFARSIRGYELREQVGAGDFGVVYRAYQPTVGREVAIKVVRPELVNQPAFIRRFEAEAQLVAQLEHPHVVSLYDYWRDPDGAYLVMRWLRGGSLRQALERGPWNMEHATRLLEQIGGALAYAHRQGVVHRDLKPGNVLLDEEGHAYLSDFGIASRLTDPDDPRRLVTSSPAYVPPEELDGKPHTPRSDIYGLGLVTYELLTGQRPPLDRALPAVTDLRPELPAALAEVVRRATAERPEERYESVDDFLAAFAGATGTRPRETYTPAENPYKGLRAFGENDADDFFGRDGLVDALLSTLEEHRLVAVVGPSGIGKSSVVRAGLLPALRRGALPGSDSWLFADFFPGPYPFEELAAALLRVAVERPVDLVEELVRDELGMRRMAKRVLPHGSELLLVIDQFEELFTLIADEEARRRFLDGLTALAADPRSSVRVVVTLRADFLDHPLRYPEFGDLLGAGMVTVAAPSEHELAEAIERPAAGVGVRFERGLVSRIVSDVHDQPGALPLLQYALTELFAVRTADELSLESYLATGGVVGALGRRAEELYGRLDERGQAAARQVFLRLVSTDPEAPDTRRRVRVRELRDLELEAGALHAILGRYGEHRLLSFDREPHTRSPTAEVAHEALLTQWERLRGWIDERREDLLLHRRLVEAAAEWEESGRRRDYLPREGRLAQFESWAASTDLARTSSERQFLAEARAAAAEEARRRSRRRRAILGGFAVLAAAASVLAVLAVVQRGQARDDARLATARQLAASAQANLDIDPERSILLAIEAAETTRGHDGTVLLEAEQALHDALAASRVLLTVHGVGPDVALSPDGTRFVAGDADASTATVRDAATGEELATLSGHEGQITVVDFSPDGDLIATASADGTARIWDAETGELRETLDAHTGEIVFAAQFGRDGTQLATTGDDGTVRIWDAATGRELRTIQEGQFRRAESLSLGAEQLSFAADGRVATGPLRVGPPGQREAARIFDSGTGELVGKIEEASPNAYDVDFSPDGTLLATGGWVWRLPGGELFAKADVEGHGFTLDTEFSRDGRLLATASADGTASVWRVEETGLEKIVTLAGHNGAVHGVSFSADGRLVATSSLGVARIWDVSRAGLGELLTLPGPQDHGGLKLTPDGARIVATSSDEGEVRVWDAATGEELLLLDDHAKADAPVRHVYTLDVSPDGTRIATAGYDGTARVFDARTGEGLLTLRPHGCLPPPPPGLCTVHGVAFSPDGTKLATTGIDGTVRIASAEDGRELRVLEGGPPTYPVEWSPSGDRLLALSVDGTSRVWDAATAELIHTLPPAPGPGFTGIWSPDGRQLLTEGPSGVLVWDADTGEKVRELDTGLPTLGFAFSGDGRRLAAGTLSAVRIFDWSSGREVLEIPAPGVIRVALNHDGTLLATSAGGAVARVRTYALDPDRLLEVARERVTRSLSVEECRRYLQGPCPES